MLSATAVAALLFVSAHAQPNNNPPGGAPGAPAVGGRGPGVESGPGTAYRSPEVNANNSLTFRTGGNVSG